MRINCGESFTEKCARLKAWHLWFAWRPVRVGPNDCRWLEMVERRKQLRSFDGVEERWGWEYRAIVGGGDANVS